MECVRTFKCFGEKQSRKAVLSEDSWNFKRVAREEVLKR